MSKLEVRKGKAHDKAVAAALSNPLPMVKKARWKRDGKGRMLPVATTAQEQSGKRGMACAGWGLPEKK